MGVLASTHAPPGIGVDKRRGRAEEEVRGGGKLLSDEPDADTTM